MKDSTKERTALRKFLLEKRDNTSFDLVKIASHRIQKKLKKIKAFRDAQKIGIYYPIGSEVLTQDVIQELQSESRLVFLPKINDKDMDFKRVIDFSSLEIGSFDIMEPKERCATDNNLDVIIVPAVGMSLDGVRLGYGHGYYDRFLAIHNATTISLTMEKQIIRCIPRSQHDVLMDWIVTEDRAISVAEAKSDSH